MQRFEGKVALITGSARGIGRGIALCLAREGADIIINDLPPPPHAATNEAQTTAQTIKALGRRALVHHADVSDREQVAAMFQTAVAQFEHVDIVVANAAHTIREPVIEARWENALRTIEVTQFGVFHTCQLAARQMVAQHKNGRPGGKIIIISSVLAKIPLMTSAPYNMAKAAVIQFGRTLANELADYHINVNMIAPGWIDTPGEHILNTKEELQAAGKRIPWKRMGTPEDIGRAAAFLASQDADYITGIVLKVDGGFTLGMRQADS